MTDRQHPGPEVAAGVPDVRGMTPARDLLHQAFIEDSAGIQRANAIAATPSGTELLARADRAAVLERAMEDAIKRWETEAADAMANGLYEQSITRDWCASEARAALEGARP